LGKITEKLTINLPNLEIKTYRNVL